MQDQMRKDFFETHGAGWEERNYTPGKREQVRRMVQAFALKEGQRVLDVGCGEGILFPYVREALGASGGIIALDPSEGMLKGAAQKNEALLIQAEAEHIPLIANYVDQVICFAAFPHVADKKQAVREFFRVLRAGGKVFIAHLMNRDELSAHHEKHHAVRQDRLPNFEDMNQLFVSAGFAQTYLDEKPGWYLFVAEKGSE